MDQTQLFKFFLGKTTFEEEKKIREWLEQDPEKNNALLLKERQLFDTLLLQYDDNEAKVNKKYSLFASKRRFVIRTAIAVASCFLLLLIFRNSEKLTWFINEKQERTEIVTVPKGQSKQVILPDGTSVWLNSGSTLEYVIPFGKEKNIVKLDGEGYFEVAKNKNRRFIVQTTKGSVEVLGTTFDVIAYSNNPRFETALIEGSIEFYPHNVKDGIVLKPKEKIVLSNENQLQLELINTDDYDFEWIKGYIIIEDQSFNQILRKFEKDFGVRIINNSTIDDDRRYTSKFRINDGVDYALQVLSAKMKFEYVYDVNNQIIYINNKKKNL